MANDHDFKVGQTYENRRERYTVLAIEPPNMRVRFEDGREGTLELAMQARIIRNMALPPRTPEPPPRGSRTTSKPASAAKPSPAAKPASSSTSRSPRASGRSSAGETASSARPSASAASRRPRAAHSDLTLPQLCAMTREERRDKLSPLISTREAFTELIERSVEAERGRFRLFSPEHVTHLQSTDIKPTRSDPDVLLGYALLQNRGYLDEQSHPMLARRYPLLEGGVDRYQVDLLAYDETRKTPILCEVRVKATQRQWLWEALLEGLRNWVGFSRAANLEEALAAHPMTVPPQLAVVAPVAFWSDNVASSLPKISDFKLNADLNAGLLTALRQWLNLQPLLLQVPDTWMREADEPGRPSVSPVAGF